MVLAEPVDVAPAPELPELLELQAAISVTAATAASAAVRVAREGPWGATPGRLRNLMGTSWWRSPGLRRAPVRAAHEDTRSTVCQENRSDVSVMSMACNPALRG